MYRIIKWLITHLLGLWGPYASGGSTPSTDDRLKDSTDRFGYAEPETKRNATTWMETHLETHGETDGPWWKMVPPYNEILKKMMELVGKLFFFPEKLIDFFLNKNLEKNRSLQFFLKPFSG
jgi:hypothetical protein